MKRILEFAVAFVLLAAGAVFCLRMGACYNHFVDEQGYQQDWSDAYIYGWQRGYIARYKRELLASHSTDLPAAEAEVTPVLRVD